jgi:hypothetical protein
MRLTPVFVINTQFFIPMLIFPLWVSTKPLSKAILQTRLSAEMFFEYSIAVYFI